MNLPSFLFFYYVTPNNIYPSLNSVYPEMNSAYMELFPYSMQPFNEGIVPDILVEYTLDEYLNQTIDKDVATAIDLLSNQIK